jgi:hypothetical protein
MRVETIPTAPAARFIDEPAGAIDVLWNGFRPLASLERLSGEERAAVHRLNVERRKLDLADYERFLDQYVKEAQQFRTLDECIAHGRPEIPHFPWEPGGTQSDNEDLRALKQGFTHATAEALLEIGKIRARLEARRMPLDVGVEASVALKVRVADREVGAQASLPDRSASAWYGVGPAAARCTLDEAGRTTCAANVAGLTVSDRGVESLEISTGATYARASRESVAAGLKLGRTIGVDGLSIRAEAKLGVSVQLLDAETVHRALSSEDFWTKKR